MLEVVNSRSVFLAFLLFPTFSTMSLRTASSNEEISFLSILLLAGMFCILVGLILIIVRKEAQTGQTHVTICTPHSQHDSSQGLDAINIRIQFTPQQTSLVQRFRAPSALDLGPVALTAEVKKDI